jgi:peptidase E
MGFRLVSAILLVLPIFSLSLSTVLLSRSSLTRTPAFKEFVSAYILPNDEVKTLAYIGTALAAPSLDSNRCLGEQRRRARYDAKQKMKEIQDALDLHGAEPYLLELDKEGGVSPDEIRESIERCSVLYVDGGNTFYLQKIMRDTNFFEVAAPALRRGHAKAYFGASAGSIVAGASIKTALFKGWDDPRAGGAIPHDYVWNEETYRGADLLSPSISIFPHFDADQSEAHEALLARQIPSLLHAQAVEADKEGEGGAQCALRRRQRVVALADHECIVKRDDDDEVLCFDARDAGTVPLRIYE